MLGEKNEQELKNLKQMTVFCDAELNLIDFIIENKRLPNYVDERRYYQTLLRLNKKLKASKEKVLVLSSLFEVLDRIKVSNKLIVGSVD